eukprot:5841210-Prymnesium_polylepis.3
MRIPWLRKQEEYATCSHRVAAIGSILFAADGVLRCEREPVEGGIDCKRWGTLVQRNAVAAALPVLAHEPIVLPAVVVYAEPL